MTHIFELINELKIAPVGEVLPKLEELEVSINELLASQKQRRAKLKEKKKFWKQRALEAEDIVEEEEEEKSRNDLGAKYYKMGMQYYDGYFPDPSYKKAKAWWVKAANMGNTDAMFHLGVLYDEGTGVKLNYKKAASWFAKAADCGNAEAQYMLSKYQLEGLGPFIIKELDC